MIKILTPFVAIFLAFLIAKQFKPDSDLVTVQAISEKPMQTVDQMPREPVEYDKFHVIDNKPDIVSNKPLSSKTLKSMLSGGYIPHDLLNLRDSYTEDYIVGKAAY